MITTHKRARYQHGSLTIEKRKSGPDVYVYRWREAIGDGKTIKKKRILGSITDLRTRSMAERAVAGLRLDINAINSAPSASVTLSEVAAHYRHVELSNDSRTARTRQTYESYLDNIILPKWGRFLLSEVKAVLVERWLAEIKGAPATKSKTKGILSILFRHAMRYDWTSQNPIALVRQSSKRQTEPIILEIAEVRALLEEMKKQPEPFRTLVFLAVTTGLRRGELFGLRWRDINFRGASISIERSLVNGVEGLPKTAMSKRPIPMTKDLALALQQWKIQTPYSGQDDWVFASPQALGKMPYWPDSVLYKRIRPAALGVGITKQIGWHSFRRTTASLILASGASIRTAQELMRHASPEMTLGVYAQSSSPEKASAQTAVASLFGALDPIGPTNKEVLAVSC